MNPFRFGVLPRLLLHRDHGTKVLIIERGPLIAFSACRNSDECRTGLGEETLRWNMVPGCSGLVTIGANLRVFHLEDLENATYGAVYPPTGSDVT